MNKKVIIIGVILVIIISVIIVLGVFWNKTNENVETENEVITIINSLNSGNGYYGDWNNNLHIVRVNEVKKIDINLLNKEDKEFIDENTSAFMMKLEEVTYGNIQIVVVDGKVTANSILGETYDEMWNSNIFIKDNIDIEKINKVINNTITEIKKEDNLAIDILKEGDYVNYIDSSGNIIICRVLYDKNSQYDLQIISDKSVGLISLSSTIQEQKRLSYNNSVDELNNKAREYMNTNLSDNARCVGSNPGNPDDNSQYYEITDKSMEWLNEKGQFKNPDNNYKIDLEQMKKLGILNINTDYWLASRCGFTYETKYENFSFISSIDFAVRKITNTGELSSRVIIGVGKNVIDGSGIIDSSNIRPVFYIKSNVNVISGNGTKEGPYVLGY